MNDFEAQERARQQMKDPEQPIPHSNPFWARLDAWAIAGFFIVVAIIKVVIKS